VGPNGCGKSNIIDAMLWVLGESSAKHLRGDSMADVIFNGSNTRKPVGQASVEIVFDNADGTLRGQYTNYSEVSVKRQLGRDGVSIYYLNGARCRRKDVVDVFLGTGVGKGGYSVIEQGMISRVIEARPEEMRGFLEEAPGYRNIRSVAAKLKRGSHTKENRLNDIRSELEKQLDHLSRQARSAERYHGGNENVPRAQLLAIRWRDLTRAQREFGCRGACDRLGRYLLFTYAESTSSHTDAQNGAADELNQIQSR
jgi:chromosome segregation protein